MDNPSYSIDLPGPYEPPAAWWEFLTSLRDLDPDDPMVKDAKQRAVEHLAEVSEHLEAAARNP